MFFFVSLLKNRPDACVSNAVDLSYLLTSVRFVKKNTCDAAKVDWGRSYFPDFISLLNRNNVNLPVL